MINNKIKALIFDFDGVIVRDSEYIKENCWEVVINKLGENARQCLLMARQKFSNGRGSRYDIIRDALITLNYPKEQVDELVNSYAEIYNKAVQSEILKRGVCPTDYESLKRMAIHYPLYLNSATPETALVETVHNLGLAELFKRAFGQPNKKVDNIYRVMAAEQLQASELLFVGDGKNDFEASKTAGCQFVGLANSWNQWSPGQPFKLIKNLSGIENLLITGQQKKVINLMPMHKLNSTKFDFNNLFVFEMANNHQGSVEHGKRIINEIADIVERKGIRGAIKFQFRDIETFIHPNHISNSDNKHISRFIATRLSEEQFAELVEEAKKRNLIVICTPFDEVSVDKINRLGIGIIKIGSCSALDWPLLERVAETGKPVICSTGGLSLKDIDKIASFFQHRGVHFALMHCVAIYPTPNDKLQLNQIEIMRQRYPSLTIGFSTHEEPTNLSAIKLAYAKGTRIYEKHVGIATDTITLNNYSATPAQAAAWIDSWKEAVAICGSDSETGREISEKELADLFSLKRGVYARRPLQKGMALLPSNIFFAMPIQKGQLSSGQYKEFFIADRDYAINEPIAEAVFKNHPLPPKYLIAHYVHELKGILNIARVAVGTSPDVELSHHYGLERFREHGAAIINCINREYCKKIIIQLPSQSHPVHHHRRKEETFQILYGTLISEIDGLERIHRLGDVVLVPRGAWHGFKTITGVIFEEISTTHYNDDSFYEDKIINQLSREDRKTKLTNWGFHQFN